MPKDTIRFTLCMIVLFAVVSLLTNCGYEKSPEDLGESQVTPDGLEYTIVHIEGMPCLYYAATVGHNGFAGITCDWSRWQGPSE